VTATPKAIQVTNIAANAAADKLAENLVALDVTAVMPLTDVFLLASGRTERQVSAIASKVATSCFTAKAKRRVDGFSSTSAMSFVTSCTRKIACITRWSASTVISQLSN
jgi:hypothetical protein